MAHALAPADGFLRAESGAIAVDWVVLTSALVGLGLAVMAVIRLGLQDLSTDTRAAMEGTLIRTSFARLGALFGTDFSNGPEGWSGGRVVTLAGFGEVLQIGPNETADLLVDVPESASRTTITFDLIGADDLSGEPAAILIDGEEVALYSDNHGRITLTDHEIPGVTISVAQHYANEPMGSGGHGHDSRATYTITVDDPERELVLGIASRTAQATTGEFYAIDDVSVTAQ
ncbi:hypothetical protein [Jannaschia formosa]|uniref:hypothetical protein n=1 Tax=Jannaschia formosa TaxID=2259592 RepID=UPI000E1B6B6B|nr:hypothetical protein [Jannaschia formosa]TFL18925.1 hypothetical protein DR046_05795 [Jannaschia formosa]